MKNDIEDERRLLDRTVEKLQREVSALECVVQEQSTPQIPIKSFFFFGKEFSCDNWWKLKKVHLKNFHFCDLWSISLLFFKIKGIRGPFPLTFLSVFVLYFISICLQMNDIVDASQSSTRELQEQIDIYKEKNRRELTELQRLLKERGQELEKYLLVTKTLQEEVQWAMSALSNIMVIHLNTDTALMVWVVKGRPSLVSWGLPCRTADDEPLFWLKQFNPLPSTSSSSRGRCYHLGIRAPCCHLKPKHSIEVKWFSPVKLQKISVLY